MTKEDKGILGEKYVSQKIEEAIKYWGKDIKLFGPIILKYYSIYGEMTCEIDHVIVLGNKVILGETKNGYYENIDYEAECWKILYGNDITDNPVIQNHYHKEVFCSMLGIELQKVITVEFLLNYENCKIRTQYPNDYVLGKDNIYDYLLLLFSDYSDSTENDNSELCKKLQVYQSAYGKMKDNHIKRLNEVKKIEEKTRTRDGNYRFRRTDIAKCPKCSGFLYLNGEHKTVNVRKSFQIEVKCKKCSYFVPPYKDGYKGVQSGFFQIKSMHLAEYKRWEMEEHINTSIDIYEQMKEENAMLKEAVERLKRERQNERTEFENKLNSLNEMYSLKERELRTMTSELKKVKDENESYSHIVGPLYIKNSSC